jgi:hypothetical protein
MRARGRGGIVFVSSMSALVGTSHVSEYAATKAHDLVLADALWEELRPAGVDVLGAIVGATDTPGFRAENPTPDAKAWPPVMTATDTAREILDALGRTPRIVPGRQNRLAAFFVDRLMSRRTAIVTMGKEMRKRYGRRP